jgi:hypothetical protein
LIHGAGPRQGDLRVDGMHGRGNGLGHGALLSSAHANGHIRGQRLCEGDVHLWASISEISVHYGVEFSPPIEVEKCTLKTMGLDDAAGAAPKATCPKASLCVRSRTLDFRENRADSFFRLPVGMGHESN